jgi:hypothetical protein
MAFSVSIGSVAFRTILVDITYLCNILCDCALDYYRSNSERFGIECNVIPQQYLYGKDSPLDHIPKDGDPIGEIINKKLLATGNNVQIAGNLTQHIMNISAQTLTGKALLKNNQPSIEKNAPAKPTPSKKELQFRSFFGQTFKEKKYKERYYD